MTAVDLAFAFLLISALASLALIFIWGSVQLIKDSRVRPGARKQLHREESS